VLIIKLKLIESAGKSIPVLGLKTLKERDEMFRGYEISISSH
jgi:hypothetical protein